MDQILSPDKTFLKGQECRSKQSNYFILFQLKRYTNGDRCGFKNTVKTIPKLFVTYLRKPLATVK